MSTNKKNDNFGDKSGERKAYSILGSTHDFLEDFKTAIEYKERHLKFAKERGDRMEEGRAFCNLGIAHYTLENFKTAIDYHERHLKIAKELGDRSGEGKAYLNLGNNHFGLGNFKTAIDYFERCLQIAKELGDRSGEGAAYCNLGSALDSLGDFKTAIVYRELHLKIAKELSDRSGEGKAYRNLGIAHFSLGDYKTAIHYHERGLKIAKELGDRLGEKMAYTNLGIVHHNLADYKTAIDYHERSLKIAKELGIKSAEEKAYCNLGIAHNALGDCKTAKYCYERSLTIAKKLGDRSAEERAYNNLGVAHCNSGEYETAIDYHESALKSAKALGNRSAEGVAYSGLGTAYYRRREFKTAIDYTKLYLETAKQMGDRSGEGSACGNLGLAYHSLGNFKTAIYYCERSLKIAKELGKTLTEGLAYSNLGEYYEHLGQVPVAVRYYQLGITVLNNIRDRLQLNDEWKISLRDQYQAIYSALWRLRLREGKVTEALISAEQGRAQGLKDLMAFNYGFEVNDAESGKEKGTFHEISSRIPLNTIFMAFGKNELMFWVQKGEEFQLRRKKSSQQDEISTFFESLMKVMRQEIGTLDYMECEDRSLKQVNNQGLEVKRSTPQDRQTQHLQLQKSALNTLYDIIIEPIQDLVVGRELIFVPEGLLCLAPFAAFKDPNSKYLCESFRIRVAPSLTSLKMIADCPLDYHCKSGVLLVGDPWVQDVTELEQLPYAREEVEIIGKMLGCAPLIGRQATKDAVLRRLGSVALVHIAAHGSMETGEIALAPDNGEMDFMLTMKDVKRVQIRARLVVLSCCHSAHGEIKAEGVVGIARAFLGAGARSVLVSLWAIDDKATLEFMKNFYQFLVKGKSASEALNQAMNCMRESEEFGSVKYWAPFVLVGDDVTLEFAGCEQNVSR